MNRAFFAIWILFETLLCLPTHAFYVIPYHMKIYGLPDPASQVLVPLDYSVLVILPDYFATPLPGAPDSFSQLLHESAGLVPDSQVKKLRSLATEWFLRQASTEKRARRLGLTSEELYAELKEFGKFPPTITADVVITAYHDLTDLKAMVRASSADARKKIPLQKIMEPFTGPWPYDPPHAGIVQFPVFPELRRGKVLSLPVSPRIQARELVLGSAIELKNLTSDEKSAGFFLPPLYAVSWMHRMFHITARTFHGQPVMASKLWVGGTGDLSASLYQNWGMGLKYTVNNETTLYKDSNIMQGTAESMHAGVPKSLQVHFGNQYVPNLQWLEYDKDLLTQLNSLGCKDSVPLAGG